ncbi:hypothetical protein DZC78_14585 [Olleya aquimaris]|nr:hypothetical protein DZC78_14585 [Olleya aquimaris]
MKNQINLNIKTPCQEKFSNFTPTTNGGFCNSCTKEVVDFTNWTPNQIALFFQNKNNLNTCGQFKNTQLTSYSKPIKQNKKLNLVSSIGLACLAFLSFFTAQAQDSNNITKNTSKTIKQLNQPILIKGTVLDDDGLPLPLTNIVLEGTNIGTQTDFDGNFTFPNKLNKGSVLVFSYVGYEAKKITVTDPDNKKTVNLDVTLNNDHYILMGKAAVKEVFQSKHK